MEYNLKAPLIFDRAKKLDCFSIPLDDLERNDAIVFDLSRVSFVRPPALIGILVIIERILQTNIGPNLTLVLPKDKHVLDYFAKVGLPEAIQLLGEWEIPHEHLVASERKILPVIPITRFLDSDDVEQVANLMQQKFHTELLGLSTLLQPCHIVFSELADNVLHHARSNGGFILAQQYNYRRGPMLEIAIGDCGVGIPASLQQKHDISQQFTNDREAILLALKDGISSLPDPSRGFGLGYVEGEVKSVADRILTVRSGKGYAIIRGGGYVFCGDCKFWPGALFHVVIPCG